MRTNRQTALVTGASGNLGLAVCRKFLDSGFHVVGTMRPGADRPDHDIEWHELDLLDARACHELAGRLSNASYGLSTAVFCAGGFAMHGVESVELPDIEKMIRLNFETAFQLSSEVFRSFGANHVRGRLFFIGGKPGVDPSAAPAMASYGLSKGLVVQWAQILDEAGKKQGIRSYSIIPGTIDTPENRKAMPDADRSLWVTPEALADHILWLSEHASGELTTNIFEFYGRPS